MDKTEASPNSRSGVLARAITLFELVAVQSDGIGVREAARRTGIDRSAVSRILTQYEEVGYVEQERDRGLYHAGPRLFSLVAAVAERDSLTRAAQPFLQDLVHRFNETCYLAARLDDHLVFRSKVDCEHTIRYVIEMGKPFPLVSGASGLAILCGMSDGDIDSVLDQPISRTTSESFAYPDEVRAQIAVDRALGYSHSPGRWVPNGAGISSPFFDATGRCVGALTLSCPADRLNLMSVEEIGEAIREAAAQMSLRLGQQPSAT